MTSLHRAHLALLTAALSTLAASVAAQTIEPAPTNCCTEIYRAGWELGQLRSIAGRSTPDYGQAANLHMQRLGSALEAANESCCRFCEAWADWPQIQDGIRATAKALSDSSRIDAVETRHAFREWVESRPADLVEGLSRCDLDDDMPCKWLGLVECARAYFKLGLHLGHATLTLGAADASGATGPAPTPSARQEGLESLDTAATLLASLRAGDAAPGPEGQKMHCDYLWDMEIGVERLLSEAVRQPDLSTDTQLAELAAEANRRVLDLLVHGRPDLGIAPCPIGGEHEHGECERAMETGP